jgi:endonuclease/exonuclease/phosphatase family metal-dependent hydrolase
MRFVSWNINRPGTKARVRDVLSVLADLDPGIALLQEVRPHPGLLSTGHWVHAQIGANSRKYGERGRYDWGSAVWSPRLPLTPVQLPDPVVGWVTVARWPYRGGDALALSLHAEIVESYSITVLHHYLSDLTPLLDQHKGFVLLGGDFNADVLWDERSRNRRHQVMFDRVEAFGLWHANRLIAPARRRTYQGGGGSTPWMEDHLFVSTRELKRVSACQVVGVNKGVSDHNPVVLDLV